MVVVDGRGVVSQSRLELSSFEDEVTDTLSEEMRGDALINKALRDAGAGEKDICVSLSDKDFIFRRFEMPLMRRSEITSSLIYEIEKYIPFKIDELMWDYNYTRLPKQKKMDVSFVGIRKDNLQKTQELLRRLELTPEVIEPAAISLVRVFKSLPPFTLLKNFAFLDITDSEAYLTFFHYDLPVFNRYLSIPREESGINRDKLVEAVRLSFVYFKREFKDYPLDKIIVIGNARDESFQASLKEDLQIDVEVFPPHTFINKKGSTVENIKALGVVGRDNYGYKFVPVLMTTDGQIKGGGIKHKVFFNVRLVVFMLIFALVVAGAIFIFLENKIYTRNAEIQKQFVVSMPNVPPWEEIGQFTADKTKKVNALKGIAGFSKKIYPFMEGFSALFPEGLWLESFELVAGDNRYKLVVKGKIFLGDAYKERLKIDEFILSLNNNEKIKSVFSDIELTSSERGKEGGFMLTYFFLKLE